MTFDAYCSRYNIGKASDLKSKFRLYVLGALSLQGQADTEKAIDALSERELHRYWEGFRDTIVKSNRFEGTE